MGKRIAILIPVYNGLKYLTKTIPAILRQISAIEDCQFEIVVSDDHSSDGTSEWLQQHFPDVKVLHGNGSLWWSGGINMGVKYALADGDFTYVLLWNHDTICADDYFKSLVKIIPAYGADTMIASKIYFLHEPNVIFNMGAFFNPLTGKFALNGYGRKDSEEFNTPCQVDWTGGMGTLIPLDIIKNVGLFDEKNFPQYYGDADFYLRAKERGFKLIVHPDLKIWNDKSSSGLEHRHKWGLFFRSLTSIRSNNNVFIGFKFRKRHGTSVLSFFYFILGIARHFAGFFKHWLINLFHA